MIAAVILLLALVCMIYAQTSPWGVDAQGGLSLKVGLWLLPEHVNLSVYSQGSINLGQDPFPELLASRESVSVEGTLGITGASSLPGMSLMVGWGEVVYAQYAAKGSMVSLGLAYDWRVD